jgi:hypothetical protein
MSAPSLAPVSRAAINHRVSIPGGDAVLALTVARERFSI